MLASLSNSRLAGRLGVLLMLAAGASGCSDPEIDRPGTWKPGAVNDRNLRAMLVNPQDEYSGTGTTTSRGNGGSRAVTRLLTDHRRPLLDASVSHIGSGGSGGDTGSPLPAAGGAAGGAP